MAKPAYNERAYLAAKDHLKTHYVQCWYGCGKRATVPDHQPELMNHRHVAGSGCCRLMPACAPCNASHGAAEGNRKRNPSSGWI